MVKSKIKNEKTKSEKKTIMNNHTVGSLTILVFSIYCNTCYKIAPIK